MGKLTKTQRIILTAAAGNERGLVRFGPGDRRGTRVVRYADGVPVIIAYCYPEWFLAGRKLIEPYGNERNVYAITDAGRRMISLPPKDPHHDQ